MNIFLDLSLRARATNEGPAVSGFMDMSFRVCRSVLRGVYWRHSWLCLFEYAEACMRGVYWRHLGFRFFDCLGRRALLMFRLRFLAL
jgi:hypothetical protein